MRTREDAIKLVKALADDTRFRIVELLLNGKLCVCKIFPQVKKAQPTVSLQLKKLERLGVISSKRMGRRVFYEIRNKRVYAILEALGYNKKCPKPGKGPK
ncbi:MAG: metalloregulator ArsR/SmtB family transcription factor [Candidatus Micrarchaeia archaeon]